MLDRILLDVQASDVQAHLPGLLSEFFAQLELDVRPSSCCRAEDEQLRSFELQCLQLASLATIAGAPQVCALYVPHLDWVAPSDRLGNSRADSAIRITVVLCLLVWLTSCSGLSVYQFVPARQPANVVLNEVEDHNNEALQMLEG